MTTRSAAKRTAAALPTNGALSEIGVNVGNSLGEFQGSPILNVQNGVGHSANAKKRKRVTKIKPEPIAEEILPHGLGTKKFIDVPGDSSGDVPVKIDKVTKPRTDAPKKQKLNKYGLTPGSSPFPDHVLPTIEACEEVHTLLTKLHGHFVPPKVIPPPSATVAGCGQVPDLLDAILRTLLSQHTTFDNAAAALTGLIKAFGSVKDSPNWDAVRQSDLEDVIESIKGGGLQKTKGTAIKKILNAVYNQNLERRDALIKERYTGKPAHVTGAKYESQEQKDMEIDKDEATLLSLDYIFNLSNDEAMDELVKLDGIGVKTASCVMLFCMQRPSFAVDTHVQRHCKWLGWVPEKSTANQTFSHLEVRIPNHLKYGLHQLFIRHGKECFRCSASTSSRTEGWEDAVCPIEHLVKRFGDSKDFLDREGEKKNTRVWKDAGVKDKNTADRATNGKVFGKATKGKAAGGPVTKNKTTKGEAVKGKARKGKKYDVETEESDIELEHDDMEEEDKDVEMSD